jgi:hypothetical protein
MVRHWRRATYRERRTRRISSSIRHAAPTLMALSATLNDGKYQPA